ncbi:MAG: hypothetical protein IJQ73_03965 [Kiritimatiellae bacterium]|nr:hypothetical protein [Kiritimatiellia bacterium]
MAEFEQVGLLIDGDTLYGVAARGGVVSAPQSWRFTSVSEAEPASETKELPGAEPESPVSGDETVQRSNGSTVQRSLAEALASAREALHAADGCVLALPPDELVAKIISLPPVEPEAIPAMVRLQMEKFAPVSGDALEVASEVVGATEDSTRVFAVAMPMAKLDALAENLAAADLRVSRIDSSLLCEWRMFQDCASRPETPGCHAVLFALPSGRYDLFVADASGPVFARSLGCQDFAESLVREIVLSVLNLGEDFAGLAPERLVYVSETAPDGELAERIDQALGIGVDWLDAAAVGPSVEGVVRRDAEEGHIDIVPPTWRDLEKQSVARGRFITGIIAALLVWAVAFAALFLIPRFMERRLEKLDTAIATVQPAYRAVADTRTKVRLIRSYQDRSHSLLDVLRAVCAEMPEGIVFSSISYEKGGETTGSGKSRSVGGVKIVGDADRSSTVLAFKDVLDGSGLFAPAKLNGPILDGKRQRYRFDIDSRFADGEEQP